MLFSEPIHYDFVFFKKLTYFITDGLKIFYHDSGELLLDADARTKGFISSAPRLPARVEQTE